MSECSVDVAELDFKLRDELNGYLEELIACEGSDLHIKAGGVIRKRVNGEIVPISNGRVLSQAEALTLAKELLRGRFGELVKNKSIDFTHKLNDLYRFRVNLFFQMDGVSAVFRVIPANIPTAEQLHLPSVVENICETIYRGIILVTGPTGSGKSTTLASMIDYINVHRKAHIITIEDPIEFVYKDKNCIINQRSVGQDALDFPTALRGALREDPDIILVGEMRDLATVEIALQAAETGHLVLSTLHTIDAKDTIKRIVGMFPGNEQNRIKLTLASALKAIISQRLCRTTDRKRTAALEIMISTPRIKNMIIENRDEEIRDAIEESSHESGMRTFDHDLLRLYSAGRISREEALANATTPNDLALRLNAADMKEELDASGNNSNLKREPVTIALKKID